MLLKMCLKCECNWLRSSACTQTFHVLCLYDKVTINKDITKAQGKVMKTFIISIYIPFDFPNYVVFIQQKETSAFSQTHLKIKFA